MLMSCDLRWFSRLPVRFVYWTDWGDKAFIGRVGMDGTNKAAIITTKIEWPNGITIDYSNDKLYWSDAHLSYIEYVPFIRKWSQCLPINAVRLETFPSSFQILRFGWSTQTHSVWWDFASPVRPDCVWGHSLLDRLEHENSGEGKQIWRLWSWGPG